MPVQREAWWRSGALIVTGVATVYALVVTFPLVLHLNTAIYGYPGDSTGNISIYSYWGYALRHGQSLFDNHLWGAPYGASWQSVVFTVLPVLILAPVAWLSDGTIAYNVQVLTSFPLTAWLTYLAARHLGCSKWGAAFAALAFAFIPYHLEKAQGHAGQTHVEFFSGALLFLLRWRQGGSRWNLVAAGGFAGLTLWNDFYFAFITVFVIATFLVVSFLAKPRELRRHALAAATVALVAMLFLPLAAVIAVRPGTGPASGALSPQAGVERDVGQVNIYSARPWDYLLPYYDNPLTPRSVVQFEVRHLHGSNFVEQSLFIGYTVMALAGAAVLLRWRRFETALLLALGGVGFVISLPPEIRFGSFALPMPSGALHAILPYFRVYARFGVMVMIGAALLAGIALTGLQVRLGTRRAWLLVIPFLLVAIEFNNVPPLHVTQIFPAPSEYQWLSAQPPGILVEYPLKAGKAVDQEVETRQYTLYQQTHGHPIFNGAVPQSRADEISNELEPYYFPGVAQRLHDIGIRYVFVHRAEYEKDGFDLPQNVPGLTYVTTIEDTDIYTVPET